MNEGITHRIARAVIAVVFAFTVCAYPFVCAKKAHAIAPVAGGAIAAAGALAAELGITTEALFGGIVAVTAAGTGVYLLQSSDYETTSVAIDDNLWRNLWNGNDIGGDFEINWDEQYRKYKLGNGKSWDELTDEEKEVYKTPANYVQNGLLGYALELGLFEEYGNGDYRPTPEPDKDNDPEGHSRWQKARNVLTALGVGGGVVALNEAVGWLGSTIGGSIHNLLFGQDGLGLTYNQNYVMGDGLVVQFAAAGPFTHTNNANNIYSATAWGVCNAEYAASSDRYTYYYNRWQGTYGDGNLNVAKYGENGMRITSSSTNGTLVAWVNGTTNKVTTQTTASGSSITDTFTDSSLIYLNSQYAGTYRFADGNSYNNGTFSQTPEQAIVDYDTMLQTPDDLKNSVFNNNNWNNYINSVSQPDNDGNVKAVTVPQVFSTDLPYPQVVVTVPETDVTPVPDNEPITPPQPEPEPGYSGGEPEGYDQDVEQTVGNLLRLKNPLDQVFPFCLIADFRDITFILLGGEEKAASNTRIKPSEIHTQSNTELGELNGVHVLRIDLSAFMENFVVDVPLDPVHDLLHYSRFTLTAFAIMSIVIYSFSFFLKRGGE